MDRLTNDKNIFYLFDRIYIEINDSLNEIYVRRITNPLKNRLNDTKTDFVSTVKKM